jgi:hypothetical protein
MRSFAARAKLVCGTVSILGTWILTGLMVAALVQDFQLEKLVVTGGLFALSLDCVILARRLAQSTTKRGRRG